jgi:hypothetical protein
MQGLPQPGKLKNPAADIEQVWIGDWALLFYKLHGRFWSVTLRDQNGSAHCHAAVTSLGAV